MTARTTRRAALALGAAAATCAAASVAAEPSLLLQLGEQYRANRRACTALYPEYFGPPVPPEPVAAQMQALVVESHVLRERIAQLPARTADELRAKAFVVMDSLDPDWLEGQVGHQPDCSEDLVAWSLCKDLLGGAA